MSSWINSAQKIIGPVGSIPTALYTSNTTNQSYGTTTASDFNSSTGTSAFIASGAVLFLSNSLTVFPAPRYCSPVAYKELEGTLNSLRGLDDEHCWKITDRVYGASLQVAALLMENNIPQPHVVCHGPNSVVFNWSQRATNLYLTITANRKSVLVSTAQGIQLRMEIAGKQMDYTTGFLGALNSANIEGAPLSNSCVQSAASAQLVCNE